MADSNPAVRSMLSNPEVMRSMMNPQTIQAAMDMMGRSQSTHNNTGTMQGAPGSFPMPGSTPAAEGSQPAAEGAAASSAPAGGAGVGAA
jgi:hypothetical protein